MTWFLTLVWSLGGTLISVGAGMVGAALGPGCQEENTRESSKREGRE